MRLLVLCLACAFVKSAWATLGDNGLVTYSGRGRQPNTLVFGNQLLIDNVIESTLETAGQMLLGTWRPTRNEPPSEPTEVSVSCLNSVAPPPLNWQMWCPGKDAKIMQWVDKHGATHRQITIRPQQNMTTTMAIWFLSTYLTGMLPPVVEFQGGKYYYYHLWHPLDHVESAWSFGPTVPGLQNGNIYTLIHERYRNPADWPYNRSYETNGWFFMEDPVQNLMLNRFHITMPILGLPTWNMIIEFNDVSGGLEVDIEIIAGIPPKGFDDRNHFGGFLAAGPLNELLTSPLLAKQKGTPDYDGAINAITRHVVEEFSNLQFFVPILYEKYTAMGSKGINWIPSIGDWMAASPHKITYELPAISLYDGLSAIAQLQIDKSNTTYAAVVDAAVTGSKAAFKGATDVVSIASVAKSQVYVQPANALTTLTRNINEVVGGWPEITPQSIVRFLVGGNPHEYGIPWYMSWFRGFTDSSSTTTAAATTPTLTPETSESGRFSFSGGSGANPFTLKSTDSGSSSSSEGSGGGEKHWFSGLFGRRLMMAA